MTLVIRGLIAWRLDFNRTVGKGSRAQMVSFIFLMMSSTSRCEMSEKHLRCLEILSCGSADRTGRAEKLDRRERHLMVSRGSSEC